jgi:serine/threonine-protein kinase
VQLSDALPVEQSLWTQTYERIRTDVLVMYSEMVRTIAGKIQVNLTTEETARFASTRTVNPEAHDAYLKGSVHLFRLTSQDIDIAEYYFNQALEKDSSYAPIYEGLALVWIARQQMGIMPMREVKSKCLEYALKAISLDQNSVEAQFAMALTKAWVEWDWKGAEQAFKRALELNPNHAKARAYYAHFLANMGHIKESIQECELALELDPYNAIVYSLYAGLLNYVPRYADAEAAARRTIALQPDHPVGNSQLLGALLGQEKYDDVIAILRERYADNAELSDAFEQGLAEAGYKGAKRRIADIYASWYNEDPTSIRAQTVGGNYFEAGDYEQAIEWFEKALENHEGNLPYITRPNYYRVLKSYPRYLDILRGMGLPVEW